MNDRRSVIKRIAPAVLRRVDRLLWRPTGPSDVNIERVWDRLETPCAQFNADLNDPLVAARMRECNTWQQTEYVYRATGDPRIDPVTGLVVLPGRRYVSASVPYLSATSVPSTLTMGFSRKALHVDRVISLRDAHERNYFHFFNDILTKIPLLEQQGLLNAPLVVGRELHEKAFFREMLPLLERKGIQVIEQGERVIRAQEVIYCKAMPYHKRYLDRVMQLVDAPAASTAPAGRKVFLGRTPASTRQRLLADQAGVETVMRDLGFEVHDTARLSVADQMRLLNGTSWLVALHGAGATNMIFRHEAPLDVLEIFPRESIPPHYYWLARTYGHGYQGLVAGMSDERGAFELSLDALRTAVERLLQNGV